MSLIPGDYFILATALAFLSISYWAYIREKKYAIDPSAKIKNGDAQANYLFLFLGPILICICVASLMSAFDNPLQVQSCQGRGKCIEAHDFSYSVFMFCLGILSLALTITAWRITRTMKSRGQKVDWTNG